MFLDAELYLDGVQAVPVLHQLQQTGSIPPLMSVFVSSNDAASRHSDYVCDSAYAIFLGKDVLPWVRNHRTEGQCDRIIVVGLSLSGLAAAHAALTFPDHFDAAICQSPSLWWNDEQFRSDLTVAPKSSPAFWISVGDEETKRGVSHPPTGLLQASSQIDACQRGADALKIAQYRTHYRVFHGGHDPACWRDDLRFSLPWAASA
jgi:enterochelin esterase family protein